MQDWTVFYPGPVRCLEREYAEGSIMSPFFSSVVLETITEQSTKYDDFRTAIEGGPHGTVHVQIGGDMATMFSPNE